MHTFTDCSPLDPDVDPATLITNPTNHLLLVSTTDTLSTQPTPTNYPHLIPPLHLHTPTQTPPDDATLAAPTILNPTIHHHMAHSPSSWVTPVPNTPSPQYAMDHSPQAAAMAPTWPANTSPNTLYPMHTTAPTSCDEIAKPIHATPAAPIYYTHPAPTSADHPPPPLGPRY